MKRRLKDLAQANAHELVAHLLDSMEVFREEDCNHGLREAFTRFQPEVLVREIIGPTLREAGERWHAGKISVVQEHLLSGAIRRQLFFALDRLNQDATGPKIVFTTLSGERHEMGTLMCALLAAHRHFHALYLGPDLPVAEIALFCERVKVAAVALSIVTRPTVIDVQGQLAELRSHLPDDVEIWIGGSAAAPLRPDELPARTFLMKDLEDFTARLAFLEAQQGPETPAP
jgi:methanogenic corrinoid protein MtbC1